MSKKNLKKTNSSIFQALTAKKTTKGEYLSEIFSYYEGKETKDEIPTSNFHQPEVQESFLKNHLTIEQLFGKLKKKCLVTRMKGLQTLKDSVEELQATGKMSVYVKEFLRIYVSNAFFDIYPDLRILFHETLNAFIHVMKSSFDVYKKSVFPTVWCSCQDVDERVAKEAQMTLKLLLIQDTASNGLNVLNEYQSELINFVSIILNLNEAEFSKHIWIPLNAKHIDMKLIKGRQNEVIVSSLSSLNTLLLRVNENQNTFVNFLSRLKIFFAKEFCLNQFFNIHQFSVVVAMTAIIFISNLFEAIHALQGAYEKCRAKLLFDDDKIYHEMLRSSLNLFLPQNQELLKVAPRLFVVTVKIYPNILEGSDNTRICQRNLSEQILNIVRHHCYTRTLPANVSFYKDIPCILKSFPNSFFMSSCSALFFRKLLYGLVSTFKLKEGKESKTGPLPDCLVVFQCYYKVLLRVLNVTEGTVEMNELQEEVVSFFFWVPLHMILRMIICSVENSKCYITLPKPFLSHLSDNLKETEDLKMFHITFGKHKNYSSCLLFKLIFEDTIKDVSDHTSRLSLNLREILTKLYEELILAIQASTSVLFIQISLPLMQFFTNGSYLEASCMKEEITSFQVSLINHSLSLFFDRMTEWGSNPMLHEIPLYCEEINKLLTNIPNDVYCYINWDNILYKTTTLKKDAQERIIDIMRKTVGTYMSLLQVLMTKTQASNALNDDCMSIGFISCFRQVVESLVNVYGFSQQWKDFSIRNPNVLNIYISVVFSKVKNPINAAPCVSISLYELFFCYPYIEEILKYVDDFPSTLCERLIFIWKNLLKRIKSDDEYFLQGRFLESVVYYLEKVVETVSYNCKYYLEDVAGASDDIFTVCCTLNGSSMNLFQVKILVVQEYFRCVQAYTNSEKVTIDILKNIPMLCLRMILKLPLLTVAERTTRLPTENMKTMCLSKDLKCWVQKTYSCSMLLLQRKDVQIFTIMEENQLFLLCTTANDLGSIPCNVWIEGVSLVYDLYCTVMNSTEKTQSLPLFWSWVDHFFTITQERKRILKGLVSETIGFGSYLIAFYCHIKKKEDDKVTRIGDKVICQSKSSFLMPFQLLLEETNKTERLHDFIIFSWISCLFSNNIFYFSYKMSSEQVCCMSQYRFMFENVLRDVFFNSDSFHVQSREKVLQRFNCFLHHVFRQILRESSIVLVTEASWFFSLLTDILHFICNILECNACMDACCVMKAFEFLWTNVLNVLVKENMKDITILWDQAIKEWPKLVYDVMTVCSCLMSFCCENVWKKDKKHALMGNACDFLKGKMMTDTAQYFIGKIGWSLSCLSDTSVEFHETILENITVLKISLRVLTCTLLLSYESLDSETLNERLLLVMETCMNYCFKKNATYVAWCTDWFQCIEASMNYMYLFHFVQEPEEDHSKTLSSCLFLLTHFFSLHTKWIQNETLCLTDCVFLPHCIEYLSYCLTYFLQDTGQLFLQSILAALQECFLNIQAAINFCQKLDLMQTKLWIQAFTKLCTCIQKCWETKFHNFFDSIHENDIVNEQHSKICLALTRLYSLLVHAAKHWTDFQHIQKSLWALLFCIRYPLFKWPFLQDSSLMFQLTHCKKLEQLEKQQLCLQPMDSTDTFQYTMTLRKKCLDSLFESFESIENKNHDISSNSFKALATCLFLFLGQDIAKEILTCPNIVVGALKQTMDQRTCRFNHDITWEQLLRHLYVWFLVLKEFQSNSADSAELSQYHASLFLHIPFSSLNVSECWFNQLRDSLCQVPSLYSSWDNIVQFHEQVSITRDDITCLIAQPNNLLQALIDLLSLLVLLEDEIPNCFSCEKKEPQSAKGLQACQWKISETCDQFLSSFKTFPLTCYRENNPPLFKNQNWVSWNMPSIIQDGSTQIENFWNEDSSRYLEHIPNFFKESSETWHQVWIFSIQLLYVVAQMFPIALRMYACSLQSVWMTTKHVKALHDIFQKIISPSLILRDAASICALEKIGTTNVKASVQFNKKLRQLCLTFINNTREILVTFTVHFPDIYPLRCVDFKYNKSVAVPKPKLERWLLMAKQILMGGRISKPTSPESSHQSCSQFDLRHLSFKQYAHEPHTICLLSCITFIKDNFAAFVLGLEDCFICYSIVHHRTRGIPKSQCVTCKYKFHAECVQKWFETSLKNNCPLCQSPFS